MPFGTLMLRCIATLVAALVTLGAVAVTASAQADPDQTTSSTAPNIDGDSPVGNILPRPNSGQAPDSPNDPGGWQQYLVFGLIIAGLATIVLLVRRESRRALARRDG